MNFGRLFTRPADQPRLALRLHDPPSRPFRPQVWGTTVFIRPPPLEASGDRHPSTGADGGPGARLRAQGARPSTARRFRGGRPRDAVGLFAEGRLGRHHHRRTGRPGRDPVRPPHDLSWPARRVCFGAGGIDRGRGVRHHRRVRPDRRVRLAARLSGLAASAARSAWRNRTRRGCSRNRGPSSCPRTPARSCAASVDRE